MLFVLMAFSYGFSAYAPFFIVVAGFHGLVKKGQLIELKTNITKNVFSLSVEDSQIWRLAI